MGVHCRIAQTTKHCKSLARLMGSFPIMYELQCSNFKEGLHCGIPDIGDSPVPLPSNLNITSFYITNVLRTYLSRGLMDSITSMLHLVHATKNFEFYLIPSKDINFP